MEVVIKPVLLVKLLKQRLAHNEGYLTQGTGTLALLGIPECDLDKTPGYRKAIEEECEFLKTVLEIKP